MMGIWRGVCLLCQKCRLIYLVLKTCLKLSLYYVLKNKFQYSDLKPPGCLSYPVVRPSVWSRDHLRNVQYGDWWMSNMVILKLWGVSRTQLCDPARGVEIIWGLKMSKMLNLIAYSLACLVTCTNWVICCIYEHLAKHTSWIFVALFEMIPSEFIFACFVWDRSPYVYGGLA
jgi:hypothetical protein